MEASEELNTGRAPALAVARPRFLGLEALAALRHRDFRILCLGMLLASSTIMFQYMAIGQLIATHFPRVLGESFPVLLMLGLGGFTRGVGVVLFSLLGGALADRLNRRTISICAQVAGLAVSGAGAALILADAIQVWHVFVLLFLTAATQSFDLPARQAIVVEVVDREEITSAVTFSTGALQTSFAVSPLLAGTALDTLGVGGAFALSLAGHGALLVSMLLIHYRGNRVLSHVSIASFIGEGVAYARRHSEIAWLLVISFAVSAGVNGVIYNVSPYWIPEVLHADAFTWGVVGAFWGLGTIIAAYGLSFLRDYRWKGLWFLAGTFAGSGMLVAWALVRSVPAFAAVQFFMAGFINMGFVSGAAIIQKHVPNEVRGRLMSLYALNPGLMMGSGLLIGGLAEGVGATTAALALGIGVTAFIGVAALSLPRLRAVH